MGQDYPSRLNAALSSIRGINKNDVATLAFTFGSFHKLGGVSEEQLRQCPGIGDTKVARLYAALNQPFKREDHWEPADDQDENVD